MKTIDEFLSELYCLEVKLWLEPNGGASPDAVKLRCNAPEAVLTDELTAQLQARKAEIISFLRQTTRSAAPPPIPSMRRQEAPLSFAQHRLWFLEQLQPGSAVYTIPTAVRLTGTLDIPAFEQSLQEIIRRHDSLRTSFKLVEGQPIQMIAPSLSFSLPVIDLRRSSQPTEDTIQHLIHQAAQTPFDLTQSPLLRVSLLQLDETDHVVLLAMHHIISDGWSMEVLIRELAQLYQAFAIGKPSPLPEPPIQYADFAVWQRQWLQGEVLEAQRAYWMQQLSGALPVLQLPTDFPRSRVQGFQGGSESFRLSPQQTHALRSLASNEGSTLFMTLLAAFQVFLYRYTGQTDILVGCPIANRHRTELEGLIGFFVNTLVLRNNLSGNPSFRDLLHQVRQTTWDAYDHQDLPFEKLVEDLQPDRDLSYNPLFQVKFRLENAPTETIDIPGLKLQSLQQANPAAKLDLSLDMYETPTGLVGGFEYNRDLFTPETIHRMVQHFCTLLKSIVDHPDQRIGEFLLLTPVDRQQMLVDWNCTQTEYDRSLLFHQRFEQQVERSPDAVALTFADQHLTYRELNCRSNQLAHYLQQQGIQPDDLVGICIDRSLEMIIAVLAILKAGAAYLPLDPSYPSDRLAFMLQNSQVRVLLTTQLTETIFPIPHSPLPHFKPINLTTDWQTIAQSSDQNPNSTVTIANLAYLIYTSGSTGVPKGVMVSHAGLLNLTEDKIRVCQISPQSRVLQFFSLSFDASIPEIVMALGAGATLCLAPLESLLPGAPLLQLLQEQAITHITITPSALSALPVTKLPALQMVLVGGEAPSPELIAQWSHGRRFINAYGPTETTVNASMVACGNGEPFLPTVRPSANKQLYVLDANLQPVPLGVVGELHIGGIGLARGYLHRPDLTAEKFIPNPFGNFGLPILDFGSETNAQSNPESKIQNPQWNRLYKTGDLATYLPDGRIKLLGRIDSQVKIRGFRIEPSEIEFHLLQHPEIHACVVTVREDKEGDRKLIAYVIPGQESGVRSQEPDPLPTHPLSPSPTPTLRRFLKEKLPDYLVPSAFVVLDRLPLTPNGKIDHHALPAPNQSGQPAAGEFVAPQTPTELQLAEIFAAILEVDRVSRHDDFFDLGGHSLLATQLVAQSLQQFQVELTVADLFQAPTIAELAERIDSRQTIEALQAAVPEQDEREEIEF